MGAGEREGGLLPPCVDFQACQCGVLLPRHHLGPTTTLHVPGCLWGGALYLVYQGSGAFDPMWVSPLHTFTAVAGLQVGRGAPQQALHPFGLENAMGFGCCVGASLS